jgi:hypothetical protein
VGGNSVDRGEPGSKLHLVCAGNGNPLPAAVTAVSVADVTILAAVVADLPGVRTLRDGDGADLARSKPTRCTSAEPTVLGCGSVGPVCGSPGGDGAVGPAWAPPLAGGAVAVVADLLAAGFDV